MSENNSVNQQSSMIPFREVIESVTTGDRGVESQENPKWDAFVATSPYGHLMQTCSWGVFKARFGWNAERIILMDGDTIVAGAQVLYRSLPLGLYSMAYVPMGPVVDWENEQLVRCLLDAIQRTVQRRGVFCLKIEPTALYSSAQAEKLIGNGFRLSSHFVQWRSTIQIDLTISEEELFARLNKRHRQKIRKADREGVIVQSGTATDISFFEALLEETAQRKDFAVYSSEYYRKAYDLFVLHGQGTLLLASYKATMLAGIMIFVTGSRAYCFYGASSSTSRELMPAYLLHWEGIRWARQHGCSLYDYCGVPDEDESTLESEFVERDDGLWGVYRFKRGFGGQVIRYVDTYDRIFRCWIYAIYDHAIRFLKKLWGETWHRRVFSG